MASGEWRVASSYPILNIVYTYDDTQGGEMVAERQAYGRGEGVRQTHFISDLFYFDSINHYSFMKREALEVLCERL